jgi:hypothetical protein
VSVGAAVLAFFIFGSGRAFRRRMTAQESY